MNRYIALIRKARGTEYGVDFPDFPGCISAGRTLDEALAMGAEALAFHIEGMREDGDAIPAPSPIEKIMKDRHNRDAVAVLIPAGPDPSRAIRLSITLEESLVAELDRAAERTGATRSGFLADAVRSALYGHGWARRAKRRPPSARKRKSA